MQENKLLAIKNQPRFGGIFEDGNGFSRRIRLTSHIYDDCSQQIQKAISNDLNGFAVSELETKISSYLNVPFAIATNSGTSAMHMAYRLAARKAYGTDSLDGKRVFCTDLCQVEQAMPILYENGIPTFIDVNNADYNMDPECLEKAFEIYPDTKIVVTNHFYGFPGQITEIKRICKEHEAILIENASDSFGAKVEGSLAGSIGDIGVLDFGKDKIISGDCGGILIARERADAEMARKWTLMSRNSLPWTHVDAVGCDCCMNGNNEPCIPNFL